MQKFAIAVSLSSALFAANLTVRDVAADGIAIVRISSGRLAVKPMGCEWVRLTMPLQQTSTRNPETIFGYWTNTSEGSFIVYQELSQGGFSVMRSSGQLLWKARPTVPRLSYPAVTADGSAVFFLGKDHASGQLGLWRVSESAERLIVPLAGDRISGPRGLSLTADGRSAIFSYDRRVVRCSIADATCAEIAVGDSPAVSPNGAFMAYYPPDGRLTVVSTEVPSKSIMRGPKPMINMRIHGRLAETPVWCTDERYLVVNRGTPGSSRLEIYRVKDGARLVIASTGGKTMPGLGCIDRRVSPPVW